MAPEVFPIIPGIEEKPGIPIPPPIWPPPCWSMAMSEANGLFWAPFWNPPPIMLGIWPGIWGGRIGTIPDFGPPPKGQPPIPPSNGIGRCGPGIGYEGMGIGEKDIGYMNYSLWHIGRCSTLSPVKRLYCFCRSSSRAAQPLDSL